MALVSRCVFMFAYCVLRFVRTALADASSSTTMVTGVYFQIATYCLSGRRARMCSSMKSVPNSISIAQFSATVNSIAVSKSPIPIYSVTLPRF